MTQSLELVNSGVPFATGDSFTDVPANFHTDNAELAWANAIANATPAVWALNGSSSTTAMPRVSGGWLWMLSSNSYNSMYEPLRCSVDGSVTNYSSTGLAAASAPFEVCHDDVYGRWFAVRGSAASTSRWISSADNMVTFTSHTETTAIVTADLLYNGRGIGTGGAFIMCGTVGGVGGIVTSSGTAEVYSGTNASATSGLSAIAASGDGLIVAVGAGAVSYSDDYGVSWTHGTMNTAPATMEGILSLSWSSNLELFICSGVLSTGELFWATSATGASWTTWSYTSQVVIDPIPMASATSVTCGITTIGKTMIAPYVLGDGTRPLVGVIISTDNGASWRPIPGGAQMANVDNIRAIPMGNRIAVVSRNGCFITGSVTSNDKANAA